MEPVALRVGAINKVYKLISFLLAKLIELCQRTFFHLPQFHDSLINGFYKEFRIHPTQALPEHTG